MQNSLKPNHLAAIIDHQRSAGSTIPEQLREKCLRLNLLSKEITTRLDNCLPKEILNTLWVSKYDDGNLTLSVQSQTAANHLCYQKSNLIIILRTQSSTFNQLTHINIIVTYPTSIAHLNKEQTRSKQRLNSVSNHSKNHTKYELTKTTKRTIAHTAKHVIKDQRLKNALEKLIKR